MLEGLTLKIEKKRKTGSPFWRALGSAKDLGWKYTPFGDSLWKYNYYKNTVTKRILKTKPLTCDPDSKFEAHILTCERDVLDAIWSLKSFYHYNDLDPLLVIHGDGTLTKGSIKTFEKHFKGCRVIRKQEADKKVRPFVKGYKYSHRYRFPNHMFHSIKLLDFFHFSETPSIFFMDSDLLFFRPSKEILKHFKHDQGFFMSDYKSSYSFTPEELGRELGMKIVENVNSGLVHFPKDCYDRDLLERVLELAHKNDYPHKGWLEQTTYSVFFSKERKRFTRLSKKHQISRRLITDDTISHHFVFDGSRQYFYLHGMKYLIKQGFLKEVGRT